MKIAFLLAGFVFFVCCALRAADDAKKPTFKISTDDDFRKPLIRVKAPEDSNKERPLDVITRFLEKTSSGDFDEARKCCLLGGEELGDYKSVGERNFIVFCDKLRNHVTDVVVSGSTLPGKGPYWAVWYKSKDGQGKEEVGYFDLIIHEKKWVILEKPHWLSIVSGNSLPIMW